MRLKHRKRFMKGFQLVVEAVEGHCLLGGRMVEHDPVFEILDALDFINGWIRMD